MLNQVTIQGRLIKDSEVKTLSNGTSLVMLTIACQRNYKNNQGEYEADFIECVAFGKQGEIINNYFHKGDEILVTGELQTRLYEDQQGKKHKVYSVSVGKAYFCGTKKKAESPATQNQVNEAPAPSGEDFDAGDSLPFSV